MAVRLFHFTTRDAVPSILTDGFRDGEDGGVWFSQWPDAWGEAGRSALLEVMADLTEGEIAGHAVPVVADEVMDDDAGDFIKVSDESEIERFVWYKIPAAVVNAHGSVRVVSADERRRLMNGLDD